MFGNAFLFLIPSPSLTSVPHTFHYLADKAYHNSDSPAHTWVAVELAANGAAAEVDHIAHVQAPAAGYDVTAVGVCPSPAPDVLDAQ